MEQIAVVKNILENGMAQIAVERETACGAAHSCAECAGCEKMMTNTHTVVVAYNDAHAGKAPRHATLPLFRPYALSA